LLKEGKSGCYSFNANGCLFIFWHKPVVLFIAAMTV